MTSTSEPRTRLLKWQRWITDIEDDLFRLWYDDIRYHQLQELSTNSPADLPTDDFAKWVGSLFFEALALGVRRQADRNRDSVSLANLLADVARYPETFLNAPWYVAVLHDSELPSDVGTVQPSDIARTANADLARLVRVCDETRRCVNKTLAHWGKRAQRERIAIDLADVRQAMEELRSLLQRYGFALTHRFLLSGPLPDYDWMQAFLGPWTTTERIVEYYNRDYGEYE